MARHRQMRRQIEDLEEEACRERSKCRQLQRNIDDLNEANETLTRENAQLKSLAALARRSGLNRASTSRFGSKRTFYSTEICDIIRESSWLFRNVLIYVVLN